MVCAAVVTALGAPPQEPATEPPTNEPEITASKADADNELATKAIREQVDVFTKAYNTPDVEALTRLFTDDALVVDSNGDTIRGKAAIAEMYSTAFQDAPDVKLTANLEGVHLITPDVIRVEGQSRLCTGTEDASDFHRFSALLVNKNGQWRIAELRDYTMPAEDVSTYDRLKELEWLVGDWVDEDAENKVTNSIFWAENQSFLVRTYTAELQGQKPSSGTMFIGWDPQTGQIKSWVFDSEGRHSEGLWTRAAENEWLIKARGVLRDGRLTSATQIVTPVNKDAMKIRSIDRIIGGQVVPDIPEILMVRRPPLPTTNAISKSSPAPTDEK